MVKVIELRINYEKPPVIGATGKVQFSWIMESTEKNVIQKAYQLQIAQEPDFQEMEYDSGEVASEKSAHIFTDQFQLLSACRYFARVRTKCLVRGTADGQEKLENSEFSEPVCMITALASNQEFAGEFISAETEADCDVSKGTYVRNEFRVDGAIKEAYAFTTALGLYEFYLNGKKVGEDFLTPGWTSYHKHLMYQTYDVAGYLKQGENGIGALLGAGWYKGLIGFKGFRNLYGKQTAFACHLIIRYEDGREQLVLSDENWTGHDSPVLFSEIYDGEIYDAHAEINRWSEAGLSGWDKVNLVPFPKDVLEAQTGSRVHEVNEMKAADIFQTPQGDLVVDFKQNMSALLHITASGKPGDVIEIQCFEVLDKDGNVYLDNLRSAKQKIRYIFAREETITYRPHFTFMGFQYIKIISFPGIPKKESFTAYALHSDMGQTGFFHCSNPDLNQLMHNVLWGLKSNFIDIPTDCPQRNERLGWTGDAQIFCRTASFLMNTYTFYAKWLEDVAADQTSKGGVPHVVPDIITDRGGDDWLVSQGTHSAAAWADVAVINPWTLYLTYGDKVILEKQYLSMKHWIDFMKQHAVDYIWNYKLQFGDWVALDAEEGSYFGATPNDLTCTAYFAYSTGLFVKILQILDKNKEAEEYKELYKHIVEKFQRTFFDSEGSMTAQTQTAHIIALYFQLTPAEYIPQTINNLKELLKKENGHLVTGFVGTPYFCHALSQNGALKEAYELLLKDDFPSWLYQVKQGATTVWEHWDGKKPDGSMWSPDMNSFNHYAYGAIGEWIVRVVGGLETDEKAPGYQHFQIAPRIGGDLSFVDLVYDSVYGMIKIHWEDENLKGGIHQNNNIVTVTVTIPVNTTATIQFEGSEIVKNDHLLFHKTEKYLEAEAGSGTYTLQYRK